MRVSRTIAHEERATCPTILGIGVREFQNFGIKLGLRTKKVANLMEKACLSLEATESDASSKTLYVLLQTETNSADKHFGKILTLENLYFMLMCRESGG